MDFSTINSFVNKLFNCVPSFISNTIYEKYFQFWPIFLIGLLVSLLLTPIIGNLALKYDITYVPGVKRKGKEYDNSEKALHEGITPSLGGLAITIPALIVISVFFKLDSLLVVNQMNGLWKIKNKDLWPINKLISDYRSLFKKVEFVHVRREFNKLADAMANKVLDERE